MNMRSFFRSFAKTIVITMLLMYVLRFLIANPSSPRALTLVYGTEHPFKALILIMALAVPIAVVKALIDRRK